MNLFDVAVASKLAGGGGGGGSSDFTTVTVTMTNSTNEDYDICIPYKVDADEENPNLAAGNYSLEGNTSSSVEAILYKGCCVFVAPLYGGVITVTGDAEAMGSFAFITGTCTITLT